MSAWTFTDPVTLATYVLPRNPKQASSPNPLQRATQSLVPPIGGTARAMQSREIVEWSFGGKWTGTAAADMATWKAKKYPIHITDHNGATYEVALTKFEPTESLPSAAHPLRGTYVMVGLVLRRMP